MKLNNYESGYARSLIEASLDPLVTIDTKGKIMDVNGAMTKIAGETRENIIGTDFKIYFTDPEKAQKVYQEVFEKGFVTNYPLTIIDGELTDVLFNGSVYKDEKGNILGAVVVARDVTEQRSIEKELTEAKVFAEDAMKSKQQFLSNMSHEIRTPMNAIIGFTKVLSKTDMSEKQKEYISAIKTSGDTLIVLINDILDLAKVDAGKMTFEKIPFKMAASLSTMLHLFETKIQEKNLTLVKQYDDTIPEILLGDPVRLHQIILNLVSNAIKFTTEGTITVKVSLLKDEKEQVTIEFSVTDTGIGIPLDKIEKIFENFQQESTGTSRLYGGTGLGLAIAKQLVETQGGVISVESEMDKGSRFSFILYFLKTKTNIELDNGFVELDSAIKNIKVLVVEDIALNRLLMKTLLDDFGFEHDMAENGKIAIELIQKTNYDIILMDLQMPELNGFEATEYIRNKMNSKIPIIALTADVTTVDITKCKAVGMNDYISKPVDEKELYKKILDQLQKPAFGSEKRSKDNTPTESQARKYVNLKYLSDRTKANPKLMLEMISTYLEQTPPLIDAMKQSLHDKNWNLLQGAVHKMIPSFSIMGLNKDFENLAQKIQEYANNIQVQNSELPKLVSQLEGICAEACKELEAEFHQIRKAHS